MQQHVPQIWLRSTVTRALPIAVSALIGIQNGVQITLTRFVAAHVPPATLALARYLIALALLGPLALAVTKVRFRLRDVISIGVLGVLNFGAMIAIQNQALRAIPAGRGALIFATFPCFTLLFSVVVGFERMTWAKATGVLMTLVGVALVLGDSVLAGRAEGQGEVLMLLSAILAALCSTLYRPFVRRYPAIAVSSFAILCADAALLPVALAEQPAAALSVLPPSGWAAVGAVGVMSAVFYWLWLWALGRLPPAQVTVFHALAPVTAAASGMIVLGEALPATFLLGLGIVVAGFIVAFGGRAEPS